MIVPETEVIISKEGVEVFRRVVTPGEYTIGRDADCELRIDVPLVSRQHARLTVNYHELFIEDLASSNGTSINGQPVTKLTRLFPTQRVQIGEATMELRRRRLATGSDATLAPETALVRRVLPEEFRNERKYELGHIVAQGGMGAILDAKELTTGRTVAVKVMLESGSEADLLRFIHEAQITARLEHPNIVPVHELAVDEHDQVFYTMKLVRGITLKRVLQLIMEGDPETVAKFPLGALLTIFQKVCDAIAFAHARRVIHRDLKPENLMLGEYGEVLVMDWGLAKVLGEKPDAAALAADAALRSSVILPAGSIGGDGSQTIPGTIMGTPFYMSPEQARGEIARLDGRTDVYSLGGILFEILTLRQPVRGASVEEILEAVRMGRIEWPGGEPQELSARRTPHLPGGRIPDSLLAVARKALALDPASRYAHVAELQSDIEAFQNGFATGAERAGFGRQCVLFLKRHKTVASAAAILALVIVTALANVILAGRRSEKVLTRMQLQRAEELFAREDAGGGLAYLAHVLRRDPSDTITADRLLSALRDRSYALPALPPIRLASGARSVSFTRWPTAAYR